LLLSYGIITPITMRGQSPAFLIATSGVPTDLRISGPGYFVVRDPSRGILAVTRRGEFNLDDNGFVVTQMGMRVQGYDDAGLTEIGDVCISPSSTTANVVNFDVEGDGTIITELSDGTEAFVGQILLQNFKAPANLEPFLYATSFITASAQPLPQPAPPGSQGLGSVVSGQLEFPTPLLSLSPVHPASPNATQGVLTSTDIPTDLAIVGPGFFIVRDTNSSICYATRAGAFYVDLHGYLINYAGMRVQGYNDSSLTNIGDLAINANSLEYTDAIGPAVGYFIDNYGNISGNLADGTMFTCGQIVFANCNAPSLLVKTNFGLYSMTSAGGPWSAPSSPGSTNTGWVVPYAAELSQFDQSILDVRQHLNFFLAGPIEPTTNQTDLAILGAGFFTVRDPVHNVCYATQHGAFQLDPLRRLVDGNGYRVQGITDPITGTVGDILINTNGAIALTNLNPPGVDIALYMNGVPPPTNYNTSVYAFYFDMSGAIYLQCFDGTVYMRGQVLLQNYQNLQALVPASGQLYSNLPAALPMFNNGVPGTFGLGTILSGCLEYPTTNTALQLPSQTGLRLLVSGLVNPATVEASTDLISWSVVGQVASSVLEKAEFFDTNSIWSTIKFYRINQDWYSFTPIKSSPISVHKSEEEH